MLSSFAAIIAAWPSSSALADDLNEQRRKDGVNKGYEAREVGPISVRAWKRRDSIPPEFWHDLWLVAQARGIELTVNRLAVIARLKSFTKIVSADDTKRNAPAREAAGEVAGSE